MAPQRMGKAKGRVSFWADLLWSLLGETSTVKTKINIADKCSDPRGRFVGILGTAASLPVLLMNWAQGLLQGIHYLCLIRKGLLSKSAAPNLICKKREQSKGGKSVCTANTFLLSLPLCFPKSWGHPGDRTAPGCCWPELLPFPS